MMTPEQARTVGQVYRRFMDNEQKDWSAIDDSMESLSWLSDDQLHRETDVILYGHLKGEPRCSVDHEKDLCFVPTVIDAISYILELYKETNQMHDKNRYILQYYLALSQAGMIIS